MKETTVQDSRELNEGVLNSKVAKKLTIGDTIKTAKHTYTITDFGQKSNAFRQFQVKDENNEIYQIQVSLYGSNSIGVGVGRSLNFRDEVLKSLVPEIKFKNTKDFEAFLEEIDAMGQSQIEEIMGKDYIDTPGYYQDEKKHYDGIVDFMTSNMGTKEFENLKVYWELNVEIVG